MTKAVRGSARVVSEAGPVLRCARTHAAIGWVICFAFAFAVVGCGAPPDGLTEIVLVVEADATVPFDDIEVALRPGADQSVYAGQTFRARRPASFPLTLGIAPAGPADATIDILVRAFRREELVASASVQTRFEPGRSRRVALRLRATEADGGEPTVTSPADGGVSLVTALGGGTPTWIEPPQEAGSEEEGRAEFHCAELIEPSEPSGTNVNAEFWSGFRFEVPAGTTLVVDEIGLLVGGEPGTLFGAIVALSARDDWPDAPDLTAPDRVAVGHIAHAGGVALAVGSIDARLAPGWYMALFGSGAFGVPEGRFVAFDNPGPFGCTRPAGMPVSIRQPGGAQIDQSARPHFFVRGTTSAM